MAKYTNLKALFTAIANAIRGKEGSTGKIVADDFPERIENLATHEAEDGLVSGTLSGAYTNDRVTKIWSYAFRNISVNSVTCANVEKVIDYAFYANIEIETVILPKCKDILEAAFDSCSRLKTVIIYGGNDGHINSGAFYNSGLETLIITGTDGVPYCSTIDPFEMTWISSGTGYIYVPASLVDAYKAGSGWSVYASQIRAIEDYPEITGG